MSSWKLPPRRVGKMILSEPCQNSVLYAPERGKVRKRFRVQQPTPRLRKIAGVLKWYGQWRDADGQKRGKILGPKSMTESQAKAALEAIVHPINSGSRQPAKPAYTFGRYVEEVYIPFKRRRWKESSTAQTAVQQIGHHLVPELADLLLPTIEREDLQALLDRKASRLSKSVVGHLRWALNSIFKLAMSDGFVSKNPAAELIVPKHCKPGKPRRVLTVEQFQLYLAALGLRERVAARLAAVEGARPGEFLARRWPDLNGDLMHIESRVYKGEFDTPKNGKKRESAISPGTLRALADLKKVSLDPEGFIFASETGRTPISRDNLWRRCMKPALDAIGLGWATFQVLRRTNGTLSAKFKVDAKVAADQRGHGIGVSLAVYTDSDRHQKKQAVNKIDSELSRKQGLKQSA
jgi:integrase